MPYVLTLPCVCFVLLLLLLLCAMSVSGTLFVRDSEIRCTLPGDQIVGQAPLTVSTWNPAQFNDSDSSGWQTSAPVLIPLACPEDFFGQMEEVLTWVCLVPLSTLTPRSNAPLLCLPPSTQC